MTDPIASALADVDAAITSMGTELNTLVSLAQQLQGEVAAGSNAAAIGAQIEQRATAITSAVQAAQSALSGSTGTPSSSGDGSTTPPADSGSTDTSGTTPSTPTADAPPTGSAMG